MNLLNLLKDQLGDGLAGQLGGLLGESEGKTKSAIGAALPSILGGILGKVSKPEGADEFSKQLDEHDGGILDNLGGLFGGGGHEGVASQGSGILKMLMGDKLGSIAGVLSKLTGLGSGSSSSLLGMLAPLVMGFLGKQKQSLGLDSSGFSKLMMDQKDNIADAMPEGMGSALGLGDLGLGGKFDQMKSAVGGATAAATSTATKTADRAVSAATNTAAQAAEGGGGLLKMLIPLAIVGLLGWFGFQYFAGGDAKEDLDKAGKAAGGALDDAKDKLGDAAGGLDMDLSGKLTGYFGDATKAVEGITDEASATEAAGKLTDITSGIGKLSGGLGALDGSMKSKVAGMLGGEDGLIGKLKALVAQKIADIPGVGKILQPVLDTMVEKLGAFTN